MERWEEMREERERIEAQAARILIRMRQLGEGARETMDRAIKEVIGGENMAKKTAARKGMEQIEDRPQERESGATGQPAPRGKAPIVEGKPGSQKRKAAGSAPTVEEPQGSAGARERGGGELQESRESAGGEKRLQGGGNRGGNVQEAGVEGKGLRDGLFPASLHPKREAFLRGYVESGGRISEACKAAGCSRWAHYYWIEKDPEYAALFERMKARALDTLRDEIVRRGVHGIDEPQFYQGVQVGTVKRYSDNLLMFETKRHDPMYRDNPQVALGLAAAGDIKISLSIPRPEDQAIDAEAREVPDRATEPVDNTPAGLT